MRKRVQKPLTEEEKKFYAGFQTVVDQTPAHIFAGEFTRAFCFHAKNKFGDILPKDKRLLIPVAEEVLAAMKEKLT